MNRKDSKRKSHQECTGKTGGRGRPRQTRRHKTCPSPREISKVMASMNLGLLSEGGCSEDELLEKCIQSFDSAGSLCHGDHMLNMVLAMHSWVLPSADLAAQLKYQKATGDTQELRRLQICHLVRYWLTQHPEVMHQDPQLEEVIGRFWATVAQEGNSAQRNLRDSSNLLSPGGPGPPPPMSSPGLGKKRKVSLLFDHLETGELAQHLTYLEFRSFQAITPQDLRSYVLQGSVRGCPALEGSVGLSNSVSRWVQVMVLSRPGPLQRAQVLDKFIHVAQRLRQLQNFNTLMAVTGGLCHSAISRLKDSHAHLSPDSTKVNPTTLPRAPSAPTPNSPSPVHSCPGALEPPEVLAPPNPRSPEFQDLGSFHTSTPQLPCQSTALSLLGWVTFSPFSSQLWGVTKQGYRCRGEWGVSEWGGSLGPQAGRMDTDRTPDTAETK
uniref:RAS guanyl releasing protein 4 n=1 Tax=Rhinopithecus bieti TaxID=61621 RepID=A0A2K6MFU3_RHIBE